MEETICCSHSVTAVSDADATGGYTRLINTDLHVNKGEQ